MITSKITVKHFYQLKYHRECNCSHLYATYWLISGNRNILYLLSHIVNGSVVKGHVRLNSLVIHICTGNASQTLLTRHLFSSSGNGHCPTYVEKWNLSKYYGDFFWKISCDSNDAAKAIKLQIHYGLIKPFEDMKTKFSILSIFQE